MFSQNLFDTIFPVYKEKSPSIEDLIYESLKSDNTNKELSLKNLGDEKRR